MSRKNEKKSTFISELKRKGKITEEFLDCISEFTIEELIIIKLEVSSKMFSVNYIIF